MIVTRLLAALVMIAQRASRSFLQQNIRCASTDYNINATAELKSVLVNIARSQQLAVEGDLSPS